MSGKKKNSMGLGEKNKGPKGPNAASVAASSTTAATMETFLDESVRGMKARQRCVFSKIVYVYFT